MPIIKHTGIICMQTFIAAALVVCMKIYSAVGTTPPIAIPQKVLAINQTFMAAALFVWTRAVVTTDPMAIPTIVAAIIHTGIAAARGAVGTTPIIAIPTVVVDAIIHTGITAALGNINIHDILIIDHQ